VGWFRRPNRFEWEQSLAQANLERGDYLRAAIFLQESAISLQTAKSGGDVNSYDDREAEREQLKEQRDFKVLTRMRNAMAHGVKPRDDEITRELGDEDLLRKKLDRLLRSLPGR